ncbi:putative trna processing endoribonuclease protein [Lasiodiplodia theobromae]|nr:putative trna processing endoribonuclease protein [Lasiodiplodia theobromae]
MSKYFPFVIIPADATVQTLRDTKPFLLKAIVVVASIQDLAKQRALGHALMGELTTQLLVQGRRSVDLLQGILVWLAWYHVHFFTNPQTTNLLQLAVGLVIDLGLKRGARAYGSERLERGITRSAHGELANSELHTSDERRALLGCFYLSTIVAQWAKRYDSLRYSAQFADVCRYLEEAEEYPSDRYLVYLVRLQCIVQRIERKVPIDDFTADTMIPIAMFVKALHGELNDFKKSLPADLADHPTMWLHYYSAEIYLYEISLSSLPSTTQYGDYTYRRLEMLNACMHAARAFIDTYHQIPPSHYINMPFMHFAQLTSTIIALSKLTRLECPGWDQAYAQEFIDFGGIMMKTSARYEEARTVAEVPVADNPLFTFFARKLRFIKAWNEAKQKGTEQALEAREDSRRAKAAKAAEAATASGSGTPAAPVSGAAGKSDGASLNVNIGGEPMQLEHIGQDDIFEQLDPTFWQEWATGDLTMWDADAMQQSCNWSFEGMGGGYQ